MIQDQVSKSLPQPTMFSLLHNIVRSNPQYTHDQIFEMEVATVYEMIYTDRLNAYRQHASNDIHRNLNKHKK